jgi:hypothetical protein
MSFDLRRTPEYRKRLENRNILILRINSSLDSFHKADIERLEKMMTENPFNSEYYRGDSRFSAPIISDSDIKQLIQNKIEFLKRPTEERCSGEPNYIFDSDQERVRSS